MTTLERINFKIKNNGLAIEFLDKSNIDSAINLYRQSNQFPYFNDTGVTHGNNMFKTSSPKFTKFDIVSNGCSVEEVKELAKHFDFYYVQSGNITMLLNKDYGPRNQNMSLIDYRDSERVLGTFYYAVIDKNIQIIPKEKIQELLRRIGEKNDKT